MNIVNIITNFFKTNRWLFTIYLLIILFSIFSRFNLSFNTPYMDEYNYLFSAKEIISGSIWDTKSYIFSSNLPLYILYVGDYFAGILGARFISLLLGFSSIYFIFITTNNLYNNKNIAFISSLLFISQSTHIFVSKFATYDSLNFFFFSLTLMLCSFYYKEDKKYYYPIFIVISFLLSVFSKYISIIYLPFLFILFFIKESKKSFIYISLTLIPIFAYLYLYMDSLTTLYNHQILSVHLNNSDIIHVLENIIITTYDKILAFLLLFFIIKKDVNDLKKDNYLLILSLPLVIYHIYSKDIISLYKHINYFLLFVIPVLSSYFYLALNFSSRKNYFYSIAILCFILFTSIFNLHKLENGYPNNSEVISIIEKIDPNSHILSEDPYMFRYLLFKKNIKPNIEDIELNNDDIVIKKILNSDFDYIYLNQSVNKGLYEKIQSYLSKKKKLIYFKEYKMNKLFSNKQDGKLYLYKKP
jgi:4-amino-4-deoxy-L-arabinose transferase-like glycosyltransferase